MSEPKFEVKMYGAQIEVSEEMLADAMPFDEMMRRSAEGARAFRALPPEEQERILAERKAAYEADRCAACGCHPDEHGAC